MPHFSDSSMENLEQCDERIQELLLEVIKYKDCSITEGHRGEEAQNRYYREGKSNLRFPESKHNSRPSKAVHVLPYPFRGWDNKVEFAFLAGYIKAIADQMGYRIRWGGDWDNDGELLTDQRLDDLAHYEILEDDE